MADEGKKEGTGAANDSKSKTEEESKVGEDEATKAEKFEDALQYPSVMMTFDSSPDDIQGAHDLSIADWQTVFTINKLLHGFHIREEHQDVVRARRNAFELSNSGQRPYFEVEDGSSLQVSETKNEFQRSLAQNAFSQRCIESDISAGDFGIMAGISGKRERTKSSSKQVSNSDRRQEYYATFNFPRARILLDEIELKVSDQCSKELLALQAQPSYEKLQQFFKLFGHVFVTSVLLGGQQKTSKFASALKASHSEDQQEALRSAFGAKVNAQYVSASMQISSERKTGETKDDSQYTNLSYLGTSTNGGNALIGSEYVADGPAVVTITLRLSCSIPKWALTLASFKTWRAIENEIAEPIHELIGKIEGWNHIPNLFKSILNSRPTLNRPWSGRFSFLMDGKPLCWFTNTAGDPCLWPTFADWPKAIFTVASAADMRRPGIKQDHPPQIADLSKALHVDWPLYLQSTLPGYEEELPIMIGKFLSGAGQVVLSTRLPQGSCRFSLRHVVSKGDRWAPHRQQIVRSGDTVLLYCHSLGIGPFANITRPPEEALPVMCIGQDDQIVLPVPRFTDQEDNYRLISSYDVGTMPAAEQEAYERMGIFTTDNVEMSRHDLIARGIISPVDARNEMSRLGKVTVNSKTALQDPSKIKDAAMDQIRADAVHEAQERCATAFRRMMAGLGSEYKAAAEDEDFMTPTVAMLTVVFE